ncbi:laminin subunit alpha [Acrasis kona]|uniref:Laminin subunit alpha n=1 Tax=Acrasis kona TaxID=1008807 RepID=A0AAW2ZKV7_9EUKA
MVINQQADTAQDQDKKSPSKPKQNVDSGKSRVDVHNYFSRHNIQQLLTDVLYNCVEENVQNPIEYLYNHFGAKVLHTENQHLTDERLLKEKDEQIKQLQEQNKKLEEDMKEQDIKHDQELKGLQQSKESIQRAMEADQSELEQKNKQLEEQLKTAQEEKEKAVQDTKAAMEVLLREAQTQIDLHRQQHEQAEHQVKTLQDRVDTNDATAKIEQPSVDNAFEDDDFGQVQDQVQQQVMVEPENAAQNTSKPDPSTDSDYIEVVKEEDLASKETVQEDKPAEVVEETKNVEPVKEEDITAAKAPEENENAPEDEAAPETEEAQNKGNGASGGGKKKKGKKGKK